MPFKVLITPEFGWTQHEFGDAKIWFKGHLNTGRGAACGVDAAGGLRPLVDRMQGDISGALRELDGHFAFVIQAGGRLLAAVDRIRSIPLFIGRAADGLYIDAQARRLRRHAAFKQFDDNAALEIAMGGWAIGDATLFADMKQLQSGGFLLGDDGAEQLGRYYVYDAWRIAPEMTRERLKRDLEEVTRATFKKMIDGLDGRRVMLPLSAGLDSRLIASALKIFGYKNVVCFAYGRPGNFEARTSKSIAERLGYRWLFVPYSPAVVSRAINTADYAAHEEFADTLASVPFTQDFVALDHLRRNGESPSDAIYINGQSGDFITGAHVPAVLYENSGLADQKERKMRILHALIAKHFSLWRDLSTTQNKAQIASRLWADIAATGGPAELSPAVDHGVYEMSEYQERQAKFVVSGQRVYEFFGYDWRLPLWDRDFVEFWRPLSVAMKQKQNLYAEFLFDANWGEVWRPLRAPYYLSPRWAAGVRYAAKILCAPLGRARWHEIDRRVFSYWTHNTSTTAYASYRHVLFDRRGFRNPVALRSERYLAERGVGPDGRPLTSSVAA